MSKTKKSLLAIMLMATTSLLLVAGLSGCVGQTSSKSSNSSSTNKQYTYSKDNFKVTDKCEIDIKDYGKVVVGLDANSAPETVKNFKELVNQGFYNGLTFHRIMKGFCLQGGDPKGDGTGGSTNPVKGEFTANGVENLLSHTAGAISMARSQSNNSGSSQFFITPSNIEKSGLKSLDGNYACFGYVESGLDIVDKVIAQTPTTDSNGTVEKAKQPVITSIKMIS